METITADLSERPTAEGVVHELSTFWTDAIDHANRLEGHSYEVPTGFCLELARKSGMQELAQGRLASNPEGEAGWQQGFNSRNPLKVSKIEFVPPAGDRADFTVRYSTAVEDGMYADFSVIFRGSTHYDLRVAEV